MLTRSRLMLAAAAIICTWAASLGYVTWSASAASSTQTEHTSKIADHETRLRSLEPRLERIENDVTWIRRALERSGHAPQ